MIKKLSLVLAFGLAVTLPSAYATLLVPGTPATAPDVFATGIGAGSTLLASLTDQPIIFPTGGGAPPADFSATYSAWVYRDPVANLACLTGGCLDFVYQVTNTSDVTGLTPGVMERITASNFGNYITDVGYQPVTGDVAPLTVDRSISGTAGPVIGWNFPGVGEITGGQTTDLLIVETNAIYYANGTISAQNGTTGDGVAFEPSVPEPMSMSLLGGGLALLGLARIRRAAKKS